MNTSMSWIKAYVPGLEVSAKEYMDAMTLTGTKVEGFEQLDADLDKIVVGKIEKIEKHPDADKLIVCQINVGKEELLQIVTGAPNVSEGDYIPVVLHGGRVAGGHDGSKTPGGIKITKGKLRGVVSNGMLCSIEELGATREQYPEAPEDGIYLFQEEMTPGEDAVKALGLDDVFFSHEITSNRVDCFSVLGIAREAAATFGREFVPPVVKETGTVDDVADYISVEVLDEALCPRYCARAVKNVKIAPSPRWLARRLASQGIRPINNMVDITNYVMAEYGQPMHAYDQSTIEGKKILVRRAAEGETFVTLDGQERHLDSSVLMICDAVKPIGLAGIMGGENSMITDSVDTMILEAACFDGTNIRLSSKKVGLRTDASGKFEKGLDPNTALEAINRACQLIEELGAGEVVRGVVDFYPKKREGRRIAFECEKMNKLLGTKMDADTMLGYFRKIGLEYDSSRREVLIPSWRQDLECMADLAEEAARFYGYQNIPATLPANRENTGKLPLKLRIEETARAVAEYCGFSQAMTYSFESPGVFDRLKLAADDPLRSAITISNPLGKEFSVMRTLPLNGLLTSLATNYNRRNKNVRLYELASIYLPESLPLDKLPDERMQFALGMYGEGDFFDMKGVLEAFFGKIGIQQKRVYANRQDRPYFHPGRQAEITCGEQLVGYLGELHPDVADAYEIGERVYIGVVDMPAILPLVTFDRKYQGLAKYPAVTRDVSMVIPEGVTVGEVEERIEACGGGHLESYHLFDIYEGGQIREGCKSVAYSIVFRAQDRTLRDEDVKPVMDKLVEALERMGIELRK